MVAATAGMFGEDGQARQEAASQKVVASPSAAAVSPTPKLVVVERDERPEGDAHVLGVSDSKFAQAVEARPINWDGEGSCFNARGLGHIIDCVRVEGSGGVFVGFTIAASAEDNPREVKIYRRDSDQPDRWVGVSKTSPFFVMDGQSSGTPDYSEVMLHAITSAGEGALLVAFEPLMAHAPHLELEVVSWEAETSAPIVVATLETTRGPALEIGDDGFTVESPNYDDGAPGCCPNFTNHWSVVRTAHGEWTLFSQIEPKEEMAAAEDPSNSLELQPAGLSGAPFGVWLDDVLALVRPALGEPTFDSGSQPAFGPFGTCPSEQRLVGWGESDANEPWDERWLELLFLRDGNGWQLAWWGAGHGLPAEVDVAVRPGSSRADLEQSWGTDVSVYYDEVTGTEAFEVATPAGLLRGFLDENNSASSVSAPGYPCGE